MSTKRRLTLRFHEFAELVDDFDSPKAAIHDALNNQEPALGTTPANAKIIRVEEDGKDLVAIVDIDPKDWLRQAVELGEDLYPLLAELKPQLPREEMKELVEWLRTDPDFKVAIITAMGDKIDVDQYPTRPEV